MKGTAANSASQPSNNSPTEGLIFLFPKSKMGIFFFWVPQILGLILLGNFLFERFPQFCPFFS